MVIQITNKCFMGCPHCLQSSSPDGAHMSDEMFRATMKIGSELDVGTYIIGGGEPTLHPNWYQFCTNAALNIAKGQKELHKLTSTLSGYTGIPDPFNFAMPEVILATNGCWLIDEDKTTLNSVITLMRSWRYFSVQVTSIKGLYKDYDKIVEAAQRFKKTLKSLGIKRKFTLYTSYEELHLVDLGRASGNPEFAEKIAGDLGCTSSCLPATVLSAQTNIGKAIRVLEQHGKFCKPLVDYKGIIHMGESCHCSGFASVTDDIETINRKFTEFKPCGKCLGYKKFLEKSKTEPSYADVLKLLEERK